MKRRRGYLLLESVISLSIIMILISLLYYLLFFCIDIKTNTEDKIELQQQASEMSRYIEEIIGNSKGIMSINYKEKNNEFVEVTSIKCKYRDEGIKDNNI
ncbi:MAG: prepilin-type N-terminal cleavage/methylation domain-containing protein, partial [Clostridia bacterium]